MLSALQSATRVKPFICTMPMRLDEGWNQIQFNLADFTRRAYGVPQCCNLILCYAYTSMLKAHLGYTSLPCQICANTNCPLCRHQSTQL